jgi:hypothetical protein
LEPLRIRTLPLGPNCTNHYAGSGVQKITYDRSLARRDSTYVTYEQFKRIYEQSAVPRVTEFFGKAEENSVHYAPGLQQWSQRAIAKLKALQDSKLSMTPFLETLKLPEEARPTTFAECVDFFYPESGILSIEDNVSPFTGTLPFQYAVDPSRLQDSVGDIPLQLGEITMMYGWFIAFRQLLCPQNPEVKTSQIPVDPRRIFNPVGDSGLLLDRDQLVGAQRDYIQKVKKLQTISEAITYTERLAKTGIRLGAEADWDLDKFLKSKNYDALIQEFTTKGATFITSVIASEIGLPSRYANDIATFLIEGKLNTSKFNDLLSQYNQLKGIATNLLTDTQKGFTEAYRVLDNFIEDQVITGIAGPDHLSGAARTIARYAGDFVGIVATKDRSLLPQLERDLQALKREPNGTVLYDRAIGWVEGELDKNDARRKANYGEIFNANRNLGDFGVTAALVGASVAFDLIQGGIEYRAEQAQRSVERMKQYLSTNVYALDPSLLIGLPYDFSFFSHVRSGLSSRIDPTCELQQGGQMLDYWTSAFSALRTPIENMRFAASSATLRQGKPHADIISDAFAKSNVPPVSPYHRIFDRNPSRAKSVCAGMRHLAVNTVTSALKVLNTLPNFSPFTHTFGFAPIFMQPNDNFISFVDGRAARTYLGESNLVDRVDGWNIGASAAPYRTNFFTADGSRSEGQIPQRAAVSEGEVECWIGASPLPSRRILEGMFGGRASVSFDTAFGKTPVMDAQYCALMSVLFCYKEARDTIRNSSLAWSSQVPRDFVNFSRLTRLLPIKPLLSMRALDLDPRRNIDLTALTAARSISQKQTTPAQMFLKTTMITASMSALLYGGWKWRQSRKKKV